MRPGSAGGARATCPPAQRPRGANARRPGTAREKAARRAAGRAGVGGESVTSRWEWWREDRGRQGVPGRFRGLPVTHPQLSPLSCVGWGQRSRWEDRQDSGKEECQRGSRGREGKRPTDKPPARPSSPARPNVLSASNAVGRDGTSEVSAALEQLRLGEVALPSRLPAAQAQKHRPPPAPRSP